MRRLLFACVLGVVLPALLNAQPRPGRIRDWWENPVVTGLNLSDVQRRQIQNVTREYRNRVVDARAAVQKAEGDMNDLFNDGSADDRRANDAIDRLAKSRGELTKVVSQMSLKLRAVLTADQWQELQRRSRGRGVEPPDVGSARPPGRFRGGLKGPSNGAGGPPPPPNAAAPKAGVL